MLQQLLHQQHLAVAVLVLLVAVFVSSSLPVIDASITPTSPSSTSKNNNNNNNNNNNWIIHHQEKQCGLNVPNTIVPQSLIIGHRGASFHVPEHTLASYRLALELGVDYIEPDLVLTKDGQLVAIHDMDLTTTTNVQDVYGKQRQTTFNSLLNKTSYWVYDFTLQELQQLTVHQRLPQYRSTSFDRFFPIPTLIQIFQLVDDWNINVAPHLSLQQHMGSLSTSSKSSSTSSNTHSSFNNNNKNNNNNIHAATGSKKRRRAGVYLELKHAEWYLQKKNMDMVQILLDTLESIHAPPNSTNTTTTTTTQLNNNSSSNTTTNVSSSLAALWKDEECMSLKYDEYIIPLLVVQSFEGNVLLKLYHEWKRRYNNYTNTDNNNNNHYNQTNNNNHTKTSNATNTTTSSTVVVQQQLIQPPPPMVLLIDQFDCIRDDLWFHVGDTWRPALTAVGPHKNCLLRHGNSNNNNNYKYNDHVSETIVNLAMEHDLVLHPWTERPENDYLSDTTTTTTSSSSKHRNGTTNDNMIIMTSSVWDELETLFCHRSGVVQGIFTEHLHMTIMAAWWFSPAVGGCDATTSSSGGATGNNNNNHNGPFRNSNVTSSNKMCYNNSDSGWLFGFLSFVMGAFLSAMGTIGCIKHQQQQQQHSNFGNGVDHDGTPSGYSNYDLGNQNVFRPRRSKRGTRVPNHDLELEMI